MVMVVRLLVILNPVEFFPKLDWKMFSYSGKALKNAVFTITIESIFDGTEPNEWVKIKCPSSVTLDSKVSAWIFPLIEIEMLSASQVPVHQLKS